MSPATFPSLAYGAHAIAVAPATPGAATYTFDVNVNAGAARTLLYNRVIDTSGVVSGTVAPSASMIARRPNLRHAARGVQRAASAYRTLPLFSSDRIAVHYDLRRFSSATTFDAFERARGVASGATIQASGTTVTRILTLTHGRTVDAAIRSFAGEPGVALADEIRLRYPLGVSAGNVVPNDTYYVSGDQWYLDTIVASAAWGYGMGTVPIAVIDTGYDPAQTEVAPAVKVAEHISELEIDSNIRDSDGHGTFLSGVASALTNNGAGFAGVGYNAPLQEYKIFSDGPTPVAQTSDEAVAIREAVRNGAKVVLLAFGGLHAGGPDPIERDAVEYAISNGVTVVAASGDDGPTATGLDFPASYDGVISVGASAIDDVTTPGVVNGAGNFEFVPAYSNAATGLSLVAPGGSGPQAAGDTDLIHFIENSYTTTPFPGNAACTGVSSPADCRADYYGTSAASAQVAGTIALMLSANPSLSPAQIAYLLKTSADDIGDVHQGSGRLDAQRALALVSNDPSPEPAIPVPHPGNLVVFAYANSGTSEPAVPEILDVTYPHGIAIGTNGAFRIADIPASPSPGGTPIPRWKIGVWYDANGDGKIGPGDYFGATSTCPTSAPCLSGGGSGTISIQVIPTPNPSGTPFNGTLP